MGGRSRFVANERLCPAFVLILIKPPNCALEGERASKLTFKSCTRGKKSLFHVTDVPIGSCIMCQINSLRTKEPTLWRTAKKAGEQSKLCKH